jgi:inositol oxygenase
MQTPETRTTPLPKPVTAFRDYEHADQRVAEFYRLNHTHQTLDFVVDKKRDYLALSRKRMTVWEALEFLDTLVDDSDPDIDFTQIEHALQTAEAIRAAGHPRWFVVTGLIHDLGKMNQRDRPTSRGCGRSMRSWSPSISRGPSGGS